MRAQGTGWMMTSSGTRFYPMEPLAAEVQIAVIARALSNLCRFGGHCSDFYSVAEHSILVSQVVPPEFALQGLMHDASEAYCVDLPRPIKHNLAEYMAVEDRIWKAVAGRFSLPEEMHPSVKDADNAVLLAEKDVLLPPCEFEGINVPKADVHIRCLPPKLAELAFMRRYTELTGQ